MFGYKKETVTAKEKTVSVVYDEFRTFAEGGKNALRAAGSLNCDCRDGCLRAGLGAQVYTLQSGVTPNLTLLTSPVDGFFAIDNVSSLAAAVHTEYLHVVTEAGKLWTFSASAGAFLGGAGVGANSCAATAVDMNTDKTKTIFTGDTRSYLVYDGSIQGIALPNTTSAICAHNNRVFIGTKVFKIVYSAPDKAFTFTPDSTDDQGTLNLPLDRGDAVALLSFEDRVYVFCKRGIFRLDTAGSARDFKLTSVEYCGGEIFGRSVGRCGDSVFFLSQDGLYRMHGDAVKRICQHLPIYPKQANQVCNHATVGGDFALRYTDVSNRRRSVVVDGEGKDGYFISDFEGLSEYNGKPFCRYNDTVATLVPTGSLPTGESYYFLSEKLDFGTTEKVTLKSLRFQGTGSFTCQVLADGTAYSKTVTFSNGIGEWKKRIRAKEIYLRLILNSGAAIRSVAIEAVAP